MSNELLRPQSEMHPLERMITMLEEKHMSTEPPSLESRMRAQERAITTFNTRLEELGQDMEASFKQVVAYQVHNEQVIETRFNEVETRLDKVEARLDNIEATMATKEDLAKVETRLNENMVSFETRLNENMAKVETRLQENINAMGARVFDGFKQMITMIDLRLPPPSHGG